MSTITGPQYTNGTWDLSGTPEDDTLYGGKGSNRFEGGAGDDTVVYGGSFTEYNVSFDAASGTYHIGDDTLHNIEHVRFADTTLAIAEALSGPGSQHQHTSGDDHLIGSDLGYMLKGEFGNDTFTGNGGDDTLYGGKGEDTAVFRGNRADYDIVYDHTTSSYRVTDHSAGRDGQDQLFNIERLKFADQTIRFAGVGDFQSAPTDDDMRQLDGVIGTPPAPPAPQDPSTWANELVIIAWDGEIEAPMAFELALFVTTTSLASESIVLAGVSDISINGFGDWLNIP